MSYKYQVGQTYKSRNTDDIDKLRQKYLDRGDFTYDPNKDSAYQDYARMMREQATLAMENAKGMATANSGGYGNSYAEVVGHKAYQDYANEISAAQTDFYDRALNHFNNEGNNILNNISVLEDRENADRTAWEEDYLNAYNEALNSGDKTKVAEILGMSLEDYEDSLMNSGTQLGDEQIQGYINALKNGDAVNGSYYDMLQSKGYNVGNILEEANAYSLANNMGMSITDNNASFRYSDADVNEGIRGLNNVREGEPFHVQIHKSEHGSADNLDVVLGSHIPNSSNYKGLYNYALSAGDGLIVYNNRLYYVNGSNVYQVNAAKNKQDEYNRLLQLIQTGKGRKGE